MAAFNSYLLEFLKMRDSSLASQHSSTLELPRFGNEIFAAALNLRLEAASALPETTRHRFLPTFPLTVLGKGSFWSTPPSFVTLSKHSCYSVHIPFLLNPLFWKEKDP